MKLSRQKREELASAAILHSLAIIAGCSVLFALTAFAADPSWWSSPGSGVQGAVVAQQVVTNDGVVITNYVPNNYAVVTQGQLKQFTVRAVDELNSNLTGGAGTSLNNLVHGWAQDYATNNYSNPTNAYAPYNPRDFTVMTAGQLKYVGNMVWTRLVAGGYTNALPAWLDTNSADTQLANLGQLKSVYNFDLSTNGSGQPGGPGSGSGSGDELILLSVLSGEGQSGPAATTLPAPFVVQAINASGQPMNGLGLVVTVTKGSGGVSSATSGSFGTSLNLSTDSSGQAKIYMRPGTGPENTATCVASANGFQATAYLSAITGAPGGGITAGGGSGSSTDHDPDPSSSHSPCTITAVGGAGPTLTWSAPEGSSRIMITRSDSGGPYNGVNVCSGNPGTGVDAVGGLNPGEQYQYEIIAYDQNGVPSSPSAPFPYEIDVSPPTLEVANSSNTNSKTFCYQEFIPSGGPTDPPQFYLQCTTNATSQYVDTSGDGGRGATDGLFTTNVISPPEPLLQTPATTNYSGTTYYTDVEASFALYQYQTENPDGTWTGTVTDNGQTGPFDLPPSIPSIPVTSTTSTQITEYQPDEPFISGYNTWSCNVALTNAYTTANMISDLTNNAPPYGDYSQQDFGYTNSAGDDNSLANWAMDEDPNEVQTSVQMEQAKYKFTFGQSSNYAPDFEWNVIFTPESEDGSDPTPLWVESDSWSVTAGDSQEFFIDPSTIGANGAYPPYPPYPPDGDYSLAPAEQITAYSTTSPVAPLDSNEREGETPITPDSGASFTITDTGVDDATYQITISGISGFDVEDNSGTVGSTLTLTEDQISTIGAFIINPINPLDGQTLSIVVTAMDGEGNSLGTDVVQYVYQANYSNPSGSITVPVDEASGSRYRKIALNGLPMPDEKPQESGETDQEKEETYIDALTDGLRHSTTDAYMPVSGSDFTVSARRDFRSQVWSNGGGLRPHEQPDLPFGMCWSSNLAANIRIDINSDPNKTSPDQAIVTDETGAVHTFFIWKDTSGNQTFFPMPTAKNEQQTPYLESLTSNNATPPTYTFTRKYGAILIYQPAGITLTTSNDRLNGSSFSTTSTYSHLISATDRVGNTVNYTYATGVTTLVPKSISVAHQSGIVLSIEQEPVSSLISGSASTQSVITAISDADGNKTTYTYVAAPSDPTSGNVSDSNVAVLSKVTAPDGAVTQYTYSAQSEPDQMPQPAFSLISTYWYADIASIVDPLNHGYSFSYALDHTKQGYMDNPAVHIGNYVQSGSPRDVTTVTMPDLTTATFDNSHSLVQVVSGPSAAASLSSSSQRILTVTDATSFVRTYTFGNPTVLALPRFKAFDLSPSLVAPIMVAYQNENINYGTTLGSETFAFNVNAGMALSQITDLSGNVTTFAQADPWNASTLTNPADQQAYLNYQQIVENVLVNGQPLNGYYDDPTSQTDALTHTKTFTYATDARIMSSITDEAGRKTVYQIDSLGRRTTEEIFDSSGTLIQETSFVYGSTSYPGFITQKTVQAISSSYTPSWQDALVTAYVPDGNGRVAQETVDPGGLALTTTYAYDSNGNKLSSTDPKGQTTWFNYDSRNRLTTVTYADGSQKQMVYDARGNKSIDYDENSNATLYQYDQLNRLTAQARHMTATSPQSLLANPGNYITSIPAGDLKTSYTYNGANFKLTTTDPDTNTTHYYPDAIQRLDHVVDALGNETQFQYGANSGGNVFDSSSFKPTQTTDPRSYVTAITYDKLYRPTEKAVTYDTAGDQSKTWTSYDNVGNAINVIDPRLNSTSIAYDALNRPTLTTYADTSTSRLCYSSTGFKWKTIDEDGRSTQTQFDNAGRPIQVTTGIVNNTITAACPVTKTSYDPAGNATATINPRGYTWSYVYDARNRKVQELEPSVADASSGDAMSQPTLEWEYDLVGNVTATIDARNNETDTVYDADNRVTDVNQPSVTFNGTSTQPNTHTTYDSDGNVLTVRDPNTHTTVNAYDALNRLHTTTDAAGDVVTNGYDQVGNKTSVEDGDGATHTTNFSYDGLNRNTQITDATGNATKFTYDGLVKTQRTDALGQVTTYSYDVRDRLSNIVYTSTAAANSQRVYAYDYVGNLLSVTEASKTAANVAYGYDPLNRVVLETSDGITHAYAYDVAGNRTQTLYGAPGVGTPTTSTATRILTSAYDALNRLGTLQDQTATEYGASSVGRTSSYGYDLNGNIVQKTAPNGDSETYSFDALNRATIESAQTGGAVALFNYQYGYDLGSNVLTVAETYPSGLNNRLVTNAYDAINRLHTETVTGSAPNAVTTYAYDAANNRSSKVITGAGADSISYSYNTLNQPTSYTSSVTGRSVALTYDLNGNRSMRVVTGGTDNGTDTYSYDFENRLIGLVKGSGGGTGTYAYSYDYRTRRIVRDESLASGAVTDLVFSGGTSVQEYSGSTPTLQVEYVRGSDYGGGVGGILYTLRGGTPSYTHENKRGDVVAKTDASGSLTYQAQYEGFGNQVATSGATLDRQKSNSKDTDPTNLVDEGFRYRDLETGMFISRDPAGFVDGPNLYTYVVDNPWTKFDPEGLYAAEIPEDVESVVVGVARGADKLLEGAGYLGEEEVLAAPKQAAAIEKAAGAVEDALAPKAPAPTPDPSFSVGGKTYTVDPNATGTLPAEGPAPAAAPTSDAKSVADTNGTSASSGPKATKPGDKTYQTYTKTNPDTGKVYTGRTSGTGTPEENIAARDDGHHMTKKGYGPAQLDKTSSNPDAIRGREQQVIDKNGGAKSDKGTSGNAIRGVSKTNEKRDQYKDAANKEFGTP